MCCCGAISSGVQTEEWHRLNQPLQSTIANVVYQVCFEEGTPARFCLSVNNYTTCLSQCCMCDHCMLDFFDYLMLVLRA